MYKTHKCSKKITENAPYARTQTEVPLPKLAAGLSIAIVSNQTNFKATTALVESGLVHVTDLFLFGDN